MKNPDYYKCHYDFEKHLTLDKKKCFKFEYNVRILVFFHDHVTNKDFIIEPFRFNISIFDYVPPAQITRGGTDGDFDGFGAEFEYDTHKIKINRISKLKQRMKIKFKVSRN